jgi:rhodanese-related sulfurtransferase
MKELNRTDRLTIASILVVIILVVGLLTIKWNELRLTRSLEESIPLVMSGQDIIFPEDVAVIAESGDKAFFMIDLRSHVDFQKSHIGNARNVPIQKILDDKNLGLLNDLAEDSITVVLYGEDQLQANSAWVLLKQMSFDNIKVMPGGFDYYSTSTLDLYDLPAIPEYMVEEPKYDFWAVLDSLSAGQSAENSKVISEPVQLIKREKKSQTEGGC